MFISAKLLEHASDPITYSRGSVTFTMKATPGSTPFESSQSDGGVLRFESKDFIVQASAFQLLDEPKDGDKINDGAHDYEVLALSGEAPFRYCDRHRTLMRIHTKQIS